MKTFHYGLKLMLCLGATALAAPALQAEILSPEAALQRALQADTSSEDAPASLGKARKAVKKLDAPALTYTFSYAEETPAAYVFTPAAGKGFAVVSASDLSSRAILGYSDSGEFDPHNIPASMQWWIDGYAAQIAAAEQSGAPRASFARKRASTERAAIAPMVKTFWNQSAPYNDRCPLLNGRRSVTGCLATAEAQVLNYHQFPKKATGVASYSWSTGRQTLTCDFDTIPLAWDQMANVYNDKSTPEQNLAVANLMLACGMASSMDYSPSSSGATSLNGAKGAFTYFGCSQAGILFGDWLEFEALNDYVYNYLTLHGPLLYCGQSDSGGHAFVCDGYSGDGYFHFNWGWGGMSDGYFMLNALNPGMQGIGGSSAGYNSNQQIIPGLYEPTSVDKWLPIMAADEGMTISSEYNTVLGDTIVVEPCIEDGGFWNFNMADIKTTFGLKFVKNSTGAVRHQECYYIRDYDLGPLRGFRGYLNEIPADLEEGTYSVYAECKIQGGEWQDFFVNQAYQTFSLATVEGDSIFFEKPRPADIKISNIEFGTPLYAGGGYTLTADIVGTGDRNFYNKVAPVLGEYYGEDFVSDFQGEDIVVSAKPDDPSTFKYSGTLGNQRLKGKYTLVFVVTETGMIVSDPIEVTINPYAGVATPSTADAEIVDANGVDPNNIRIKATITSNTGYFSESLYLAIGTEADGKFTLLNRIASPKYYIQPNQQAEVEFGGALAATEGDIYDAYLQYYDAKTRKYVDISGPITFTIGGTSGITDIGAEDSSAEDEYINLNGVNMGTDPSKAAPGVYIRGGKKVIVK
ncbi:MAG: C10 family peptidase [Clostridium sp.]|nr:C10 family peptidase [Clostridium sp.]